MERGKWYRNLLRIAHVNVIADPKGMARNLRGMGFNAQHLSCQSNLLGNEDADPVHGADEDFLFSFSEARNVPKDLVGEYLPEAHKMGIHVFIYINVHWYSRELIERHIDWAQKTRDGEPLKGLYGSEGGSCCVNSPGYREWCFKTIRELADKYPIDGIFLDGPTFAYETCYCGHCRLKFRDNYGVEIPEKEDWRSPIWRKFIEFRYDSIAEFLRGCEKALKEIKPESVIYMNSSGVWPTWVNGRDNRRLIKYQDILGAEGGFLYSYDMKTPIWKPAVTAKLIETQAEGKPTVVFAALRHLPSWREYSMVGEETKIMISSVISNGANIWLGGLRSHLEPPLGRIVREEFSFFEGASEQLEKTESAADIALVWSPHTADYYGAVMPTIDFLVDKPKTEASRNFTDSFYGYCEALTRAHLAFDIIDDASLENQSLKRYRCIILPNVACMSEKSSKKLGKFVEDGGRIVASLETSLYNEYGERRGDFALNTLFGVSYQGWFPILDRDLVEVKDSPLTQDFEAEYIPAPSLALKVKSTAQVDIAGYFCGKRPSQSFAPLPATTNWPAAVTHKCGLGNTVYFAGAFDRSYWFYRIPEHHQMLSRAITQGAEQGASVKGVPGSVMISIRRQTSTGNVILHLVNFTGEMERPIKRVIPFQNVQLDVRTGFKPTSVEALRLKKELKFTVEEGTARTVLPILKTHEAIVFKP
jgi:hypothetical protein